MIVQHLEIDMIQYHWRSVFHTHKWNGQTLNTVISTHIRTLISKLINNSNQITLNTYTPTRVLNTTYRQTLFTRRCIWNTKHSTLTTTTLWNVTNKNTHTLTTKKNWIQFTIQTSNPTLINTIQQTFKYHIPKSSIHTTGSCMLSKHNIHQMKNTILKYELWNMLRHTTQKRHLVEHQTEQ